MKYGFLRLLLIAISLAFGIAPCAQSADVTQVDGIKSGNLSPPPHPDPVNDYARVRLYVFWDVDGTWDTVKEQCRGANFGDIVAPMGQWTHPILIYTNNWNGGCIMRLAIIDPDGVMKDWVMNWRFEGPDDQCRNKMGDVRVPVVATIEEARNVNYVGIDTDNSAGGCTLTFEVKSPGPQFAIHMEKDLPGDVACTPMGDRTLAQSVGPVAYFFDTDSNKSACKIWFNLFSPGLRKEKI
ncbi:hypothetical protein FEE59_21985 [Herbaspirillum sp. RU 5E]|nr:hypothetical protein [Herbaspirillum sp. RU 5E]